jgi:hypothetical protein
MLMMGTVGNIFYPLPQGAAAGADRYTIEAANMNNY